MFLGGISLVKGWDEVHVSIWASMQGDKLAFVSKKGEKVRVFDVSHIHKMPVCVPL